LYGIAMTADSLVGIPALSVTIRGTNRGTITNNQGVFSIVVMKGDVIEFTHVSYKPKVVTIPTNLQGNQYSVVQLMVEDTAYLPVTIIKPRPSPEQFARDFANIKIPDDDLEVARQNNSAAKRQGAYAIHSRRWRRSNQSSIPQHSHKGILQRPDSANEHLQSCRMVGVYTGLEAG
jgi:signal peptidase I